MKTNKMLYDAEEYAQNTYNSRNPLQRFAHRVRIKKALSMIPLERKICLLDFGCGEGAFLNRLNINDKWGVVEMLGYDPYMPPMPDNSVAIVHDWAAVEQKAPFDCITCFEVLEHFSQGGQQKILRQIHSVLAKDGLLIVSVPIEKGFPSVVKNICRRLKHKDKNYSAGNIWASFWGNPLPALRQGEEYLYHMGFYFHDLEGILGQYFDTIEKHFSPFPFCGYNVNSQVFYRLKKRNT
jgi:cyclopropane fatty-acyl-phospholipid synthase-like methyltransferase